MVYDKKCRAIGFMDSGLGGLSVLREAVRLLQREDFIYYGDSANAPYGVRDTQEIRELTFAVVEKLMARGIKALTVACNTATGAAITALRETYPDIPIIGIEPAIKPAALATRGGRILVMATPMTIRQEKFRMLLAQYEKTADIVPVPCEGLMEFVEQGDLDGEFLDLYFKEHLLKFLSPNTETIVLGCTHYPFLRRHLREFLGERAEDIAIIDGSLGTARQLKRRLAECSLLREGEHIGEIIIENSAGEHMNELSRKLLRLPLD